MATRDQTKNIPVSRELIQSINERALMVQLPWDLELDNSVDISEVAIVAAFQSNFLPLKLNFDLKERSLKTLWYIGWLGS